MVTEACGEPPKYLYLYVFLCTSDLSFSLPFYVSVCGNRNRPCTDLSKPEHSFADLKYTSHHT